MSRAWQEKVLCTEICMELTFHSPPPTPLLPAPTLSAGEYKVSGGELKVGGRVGSASQSTRSSLEAQNGLPLFLAAFSRLLLCRHRGATGFLLKSPRPLPLPARLLSYLGLPAACLARCVSLTHGLPPTLIPPQHHQHDGKKEDHERRAKRSGQS
jgi:hypothetical protein